MVVMNSWVFYNLLGLIKKAYKNDIQGVSVSSAHSKIPDRTHQNEQKGLLHT